MFFPWMDTPIREPAGHDSTDRGAIKMSLSSENGRHKSDGNEKLDR
jgi:hypothetical protein